MISSQSSLLYYNNIYNTNILLDRVELSESKQNFSFQDQIIEYLKKWEIRGDKLELVNSSQNQKKYVRIKNKGSLQSFTVQGCGVSYERFKCINENCEADEIDKYKFFNSRCKSRYCLTCSKIKVLTDLEKFKDYVNRFDNHHFLTLTVKNTRVLTKNQIKQYKRNLKVFIRRLKRNGFSIKKYLVGIDVKYSKYSGYNFHFHIIFEANYGSHEWLYNWYLQEQLIREGYLNQSVIKTHPFSKHWKAVTKDSFIVDCSEIDNTKKSAILYAAKYIGKNDFDSVKEFVLFVQETKGLRFIYSGIRTKSPELPKITCDTCGHELKYDGNCDAIEIPEKIEKSEEKEEIQEEIVRDSDLIWSDDNNFDEVYERYGQEVVTYLLQNGHIFQTRSGFKLLQ